MKRLIDVVGGNYGAARKRVVRILEEEFPGIKVTVNDFHDDPDMEKAWVEVQFDLTARREKMEELERTLGVDLKVPKGHWLYAYYDKDNRKPYVLRDRRDNKLYNVGERFVVEHFRGVPQKKEKPSV